MFYHTRELKYVEYGKVEGFVDKDDMFEFTYRWLGLHCGFYPQVWLSRSSSAITGKRFKDNGVMFGFDDCIGSYKESFNLDFEQWHGVLDALIDSRDGKDLDRRVREHFEKMNNLDDKDNCEAEERFFPVRDYEEWRDNCLFVENDQVVVRKLNLKSAKEIIVRDERGKKVLRKMGFIEDRIKIMNTFRYYY